jgi:hypothetical protein
MAMGNGHDQHGDRFYGFLHKIYVPLAIVIYTIEISHHLSHVVEFVSGGYVPLIAAGASALLWLGRYLYARGKGVIRSPAENWIFGVMSCLFVALFVWNMYTEHHQPTVEWARLGTRDAAGKPIPIPDRLKPLENAINAVVPLNALMAPQLRSQLIKLRTDHKYQDEANTLSGVNYICYESSVLPRCPKLVRLADTLSGQIGVYAIRDGQAPHERLLAVDRAVSLPRFPASHSEYRLVLLIFPFTEATSKTISHADFALEQYLEIEWE